MRRLTNYVIDGTCQTHDFEPIDVQRTMFGTNGGSDLFALLVVSRADWPLLGRSLALFGTLFGTLINTPDIYSYARLLFHAEITETRVPTITRNARNNGDDNFGRDRACAAHRFSARSLGCVRKLFAWVPNTSPSRNKWR